MVDWLSNFLDRISDFLASRKGLVPLLGLLLVLVNLVLVTLFPNGLLARTNLMLHLGVMLSIVGLMLARAL